MESAGGTAKQARDRNCQAIMPIFGKILNVEKSTVESVLKNPKLLDLLRVLKCGVDDTFDISKLRYHKIVILADADQDGFHIQCLYLTFFYRYLRPIIEKGYLYLAMPPLFSVKDKKEIKYYYSTEEMKGITDKQIVTRFKGLGEMSSDALWNTSMNPETRKLIQVNIEDLETSNAGFDLCMGTNPEPRKEFIIENAIFFVDNDIEE